MADDTPVFQIQRMYLKDLSLEIPHAPQIFLEQGQPTVEVSIDSEAAQLAEGVFEVTVTVTVTTRVDKEKVVFLTEAKEAGIFELRNIPQEQMEMVLNIVCPNTIYPYLRSNVAERLLREGKTADAVEIMSRIVRETGDRDLAAALARRLDQLQPARAGG